jgi:hypothetical protein
VHEVSLGGLERREALGGRECEPFPELGLVDGVEAPKREPVAGRSQQALERCCRGVRPGALEARDLGLTQPGTLAELRLGEAPAVSGGAQEGRSGHVLRSISLMSYDINEIYQ